MVLTRSLKGAGALVALLAAGTLSMAAQSVTPRDSVLRVSGPLGFRVRYTSGQRFPVIDSVVRGGWAAGVGVRAGDSLIMVGNLAPLLAKWGFDFKDTIMVQVKRGGETTFFPATHQSTLFRQDSLARDELRWQLGKNIAAHEQNAIAALTAELQSRARASDTVARRLSNTHLSTLAELQSGLDASHQARVRDIDTLIRKHNAQALALSARAATDTVRLKSLNKSVEDVKVKVAKMQNELARAAAVDTVHIRGLRSSVDSVSHSVAKLKSQLMVNAVADSVRRTKVSTQAITASRKVGTSNVEVRGPSSISQDPVTGVMTIQVGGTQIVIRPIKP